MLSHDTGPKAPGDITASEVLRFPYFSEVFFGGGHSLGQPSDLSIKKNPDLTVRILCFHNYAHTFYYFFPPEEPHPKPLMLKNPCRYNLNREFRISTHVVPPVVFGGTKHRFWNDLRHVHRRR